MSVSENDTLLPLPRDHDATFQSLDGEVYGLGDLAVNSYAKSPYMDADIFSLDVGPNKTRFRVHRMVLSQSPELEVQPFSMLWGDKTNDSIALPDLDEATAHTLVHYLYSGRYQTLELHEPPKDEAISGFKLGACVYCAAIRYSLPGLAQLAKAKVTAFGEDLTVLEILRVAREYAFPLLPEDEGWFPAYLEDAIKAAVSEDPGLAMKPEFADEIEGDRKFRQVVMKAVVNTYSRGANALNERQVGLTMSVTESKVEEPTEKRSHQSDGEMETPKVEAGQAPLADTAGEGNEAAVETAGAVELKLDEIDPTPRAPVGPEQYTDELGFGMTKTYQKLGKKVEASPAKDAVPQQAPQSPIHKRTDSGMQSTEGIAGTPASIAEGETAASPELTAETPAAALDSVTNVTAATAKKSKKKNKKRGSAASVSNGTV